MRALQRMAVLAKIIDLGRQAWTRRDDVLSRRTRIRRTAQIPDSLKHNLQAGVRYPHSWVPAPPGYRVRFGRSRWQREGEVRARDVTAWLLHGRRRVGALEFAEFEIDPAASNEEVFMSMDPVSSESAALADLLTISWEDFGVEVAVYGSVLELRTVWTELRFKAGAGWLGVASEMVDDFWEGGAALLVVHAFPLEYSGRIPPGARSNVGFDYRLGAMMRVCSRRFGLAPFPGQAGKHGWMWRVRPGLEEAIPAPGTYGTPATTLLW